MALQHIRSSTLDKRPQPASLSDGQLAINTNLNAPGVFFKDSNGALVKVGPTFVGTTAPNSTPGSGGATGNTLGEQWLDTSGGTYVLKIWDGTAWRSEAGEFVNVTGDTMTGALVMDNQQQVRFRETTANGTNYIALQAPASVASDKTITLPDVTGTVVTTGDTGSVTSTMIADGTILNADVNASAAIAGTKISPDFGSQNVTTTGTVTGASLNPTSSTVPTNGVYLPAANSVGISTNGSGRLFVDSSGRVGVGTASPGKPLDVRGAGSTNVGSFSNGTQGIDIATTASGGSIQTYDQNQTLELKTFGTTTNSINFSTGGTERMRLTSTGLGIGTSSPTGLLTVAATSPVIDWTNSSNTAFKHSIESTGYSGSAAGNALAFKVASGSGTQATVMTLDGAGRVLVGTSSVGSYRISAANYNPQLEIKGTFSSPSWGGSLAIVSTNQAGNLWLVNDTTNPASGDNLGVISFNGYDGTNRNQGASIAAQVDAATGAGDLPSRLVFSTTADGASSPTERMRITQDGNVGIGNTNPTNSFSNGNGIQIGSGGSILANRTSGSSGAFGRNTTTGDVVIFVYGSTATNGTIVGSISVTGSATAYNTSSDYRLKENVVAVTDGIARLQQLKPSRFNFISDPDTTVDGFIAHEVQAIVPEAIRGVKDEVDDDGNPVYQGIDQSKLVPLLTAALQEAVAKIESLEARLTAAGI